MVTLSRHLQERLGPEGAHDLAVAIETAVSGVKDQVMELVAERLERRIAEAKADLERQIVDTKADIMKWAFVFWVTQMTAFAGLAALILRR